MNRSFNPSWVLAAWLGLSAIACGPASSSTSPPGPLADGGGDAGTDADAATPADGGAGPAGHAADQIVGAAGGVVMADYGRIRIDVPAGAFAADTRVTVQRAAPRPAGGVGASYRIEAAAALQRPATITLAYDDRDMRGTSPSLAKLAYADAAGAWHLMTKSTVDPVKKTVQVEASHFSTWAVAVGYKLEPGFAAVRVGGTATLAVVGCFPEPLPGGDEVTLLNECHAATVARTSVPQVDGIDLGSSTVGTVRDNVSALSYQAPATLPGLEPKTVLVSVGVDADVGPTTLVAPITVYDADVYAFEISIDMLASAVVAQGATGDTVSKSWNERIVYTGLLQKGDFGYQSTGPVVMDLGVSDTTQQNAGDVVIHYWDITAGSAGYFTNREAAGGANPFPVVVSAPGGKITGMKLPKDGSGAERCLHFIRGNGEDTVYPQNCAFSGYPSRASYIETLPFDGTDAFDSGSRALQVPLCPSDCAKEKGTATLRWTIRPIAAQ